MNSVSIFRIIFPILLLVSMQLKAAAPTVSVFKTPSCGCCNKWVQHLNANGFDVEVHQVPSTAEYRQKYGIPNKLKSCHTAVVGGYAIEGHVPASDIQRLLESKPKAKGLAVPGMPAGSPGMEGARSEAYSVILFGEDGGTSVFRKYAGE